MNHNIIFLSCGRFWCPTKVDDNLVPEPGHWGYCGFGCEVEEPLSTAEKLSQVGTFDLPTIPHLKY